jgi:hypothetical protein
MNEKKQNFKLIDGVFNPIEAKKIVISLINNKINYHDLEDFSNHIRFNNNLSHSQKRVNELQVAKEELSNLISLAEANGWELKINSTIEINIVE